ncbi:mycothione reductase [Propionibacterium australiense]|uniref:Mycothione reductase n=1 Tax=Propionibacterium australiense TaxID=119981 RepID=A0A383S823_9ACTN|nr:mycothione reductase [Propionibacterium australiense]RLP09024.1 mycothione reductase [Propionibacterium australiense]RLP09042.1 mycothione reductase [Propionibacterium australiense]SYZ33406.1 Pyridine nucleotide disulphide reductase class-I signature [Propionibacterium australiense]VEH91907.1 Mycothione reductase [Propionibacterium australiense]
MAQEHFDICIIGSGSGNSIIDERFDDKTIALVDHGVGEDLWFGGTCLNAGCIPTKMMVVPASMAAGVEHAARLGVNLHLDGVDFAAIQQRVFGRTNGIAQAGLAWRESNENVTVLREAAAFVDEHTLQVGRRTITADQFVIAAGSRTRMLDAPGLDDPDLAGMIHTSETILRIKQVPGRLVIVGGGVEALEFGHIFASFGSRVTLVNRSDRLLRKIDEEVAGRATELAAQRFSVRLNQRLSSVEPAGRGGLLLRFTDPSGTEYRYNADALLLVPGRVPNGDQLNVTAAGVDVDAGGFVVTDEYQRTSRPHIWALGDVCDPHMLKHVANAEARTVQHNLLHPDEPVTRPTVPVPQAVFSQPPITAVGATEQALREAGTDYVKVIQPYGTVAYGWALDDETSFVKLLVDPATRMLLGAGVIGPEAPELGQLLVTAMSFGIDVGTMARGQYWAHPGLAEVVENALLSAVAECDRRAGQGAAHE